MELDPARVDAPCRGRRPGSSWCGTASGSSWPTPGSTRATPCRPTRRRAAARGRCSCRRRPDASAAAIRARVEAESGATRRGRHHRLVRAALPAGDRGRRHRRVGPAAAVGSARRAGSLRARAREHRSPRWPTRSRRWPISWRARPPSGGPLVLVRGLALRSRATRGPARSCAGPKRTSTHERWSPSPAASAARASSTGSRARCPPGSLTAIVNTGDDFVHLGMNVSPDLDTVMYTLAGLAARGARLGPRRGDVRRPRDGQALRRPRLVRRSAIAIWRRTCSAPRRSARASRSRRSRRACAARWASRTPSCR